MLELGEAWNRRYIMRKNFVSMMDGMTGLEFEHGTSGYGQETRYCTRLAELRNGGYCSSCPSMNTRRILNVTARETRSGFDRLCISISLLKVDM